MKELFTVIKFTMKDMVTRKSFIISLCIILVMIVVGFNIPNIIATISGGDKNTKILVVDKDSIFNRKFRFCK